MFSYDEVQLGQTLWNVGAYNHKVIQKIGELIYTFSPSGVWVTNGISATKISHPVDKYLRNFKPEYDNVVGRIVTNCFAGNFEEKYVLYISNSTEPETLSDVVLVYDIKRKNWTVYDSFTNFAHFGSLKSFNTGSPFNALSSGSTSQSGESLFAGDTGGKYYRLFDGRFLDNESTRTKRGSDIIPNLASDSIGNPISTVLETKYLDLGTLNLKSLGYITTLIESGDFDVSFSLDLGRVKTDWISLGNFNESIQDSKRFPARFDTAFRIAFRVVSNTRDTISIFNGLVVRDIVMLDRKHARRTI